MEDRTGKAGESRRVCRVIPQEQFERRDANAQAVRRRLTEDGREIGGAVEADDPLHVRILRPIGAEIAFKFRIPILRGSGFSSTRARKVRFCSKRIARRPAVDMLPAYFGCF